MYIICFFDNALHIFKALSNIKITFLVNQVVKNSSLKKF